MMLNKKLRADFNVHHGPARCFRKRSAIMLLQGDSDDDDADNAEDDDYLAQHFAMPSRFASVPEEFDEGQFSEAEGNRLSKSKPSDLSFQDDTRSKSPSVSQLRNLDNVVRSLEIITCKAGSGLPSSSFSESLGSIILWKDQKGSSIGPEVRRS